VKKITNRGNMMLVLATMLTLAVGVILLSAIIPQSEAKENWKSCVQSGKLWIDGADLCIPWPKGCPDPDRVPKCPEQGNPIAPIEEPPATADVVQEPTDEEPPPPEDQEQGSEQSDDDGAPPGPREEPAESAE
jgi:hypothetical protein